MTMFSLLDLVQRVPRHGVHVAEGRVGAVRRRSGAGRVQRAAQSLPLQPRPPQDGRTTADLRVLLLNLFRAALGYPRPQLAGIKTVGIIEAKHR